MPIRNMQGKAVNRDASEAKRQASRSPIVTTSRGRASHAQQASIVDLLAMPEAAHIDFEPPRLQTGAYRPAALKDA